MVWLSSDAHEGKKGALNLEQKDPIKCPTG